MPTRFDPRERQLGSLLGGRVSQWMSRAIVKSLQVGTAQIANGATTGTGTLSTAVVVANTTLLWMGQQGSDTSGNENDFLSYITLTNSTTVTSTRTGSGAFTCTPKFLAIEFQPGVLKSCQYGTILLSGVVSNTATITAVDITKAAPLFLGNTTNRNSGSGAITGQEWDIDLSLTNATTVTATHGVGLGVMTVSFVIPEYF